MDSNFQQYQRTQIAELRPYLEGEALEGVSISEPDKANGSPLTGDMIARNPANYADQWLVSKAYFEQNFAPLEDAETIETLRRRVAELEGEVDRYKGYAKDRQRTLKRVRGEKKHLANCLAKINERCDELKQQAGKWKEYSDYYDMIADEFATEAAELKRQVEKLREATSDLVDNLQAVVNVFRQEPAMNHHRYDSLGVSALKALDHGRAALREAAKGEVEG